MNKCLRIITYYHLPEKSNKIIFFLKNVISVIHLSTSLLISTKKINLVLAPKMAEKQNQNLCLSDVEKSFKQIPSCCMEFCKSE